MLHSRSEMKSVQRTQKTSGFTIVELLIVIVVIMILTAITFVSYVAISNRSKAQSVSTDLQTTVAELNKYRAENGGFPSTAAFSAIKTSNSSNQTAYTYTSNTTANTYCLGATGHNASFYVVSGSSQVREGTCP